MSSPQEMGLRATLRDAFTKPKIRSYAAETMSAFFYCFCVYFSAATIGTGQILAVSIANAMAMLAAMFLAADISGGHVNPFFSIATSFSGNLPLIQAILYCISQTGGSTLGCLLAFFASRNRDKGIHFYQPEVKVLHGALMESSMSFVLVFAFCAASAPRKPFVAAMISGLNMLVLFPLTRGFVNPAFYLGASVVGGNFRHQEGYFWIPVMAGSLGGWTHRLLFAPARPEDPDHEAAAGWFNDSLLNMFPQIRFYCGL